MNKSFPVLTLLGRDGCNLCEDMLAALKIQAARFNLTFREVDIDGDPELKARYDWEIPVLMADGQEICRHYFDQDAWRSWLSEQGVFP